MNPRTKQKLSQWLWFVGLWFAGLATVSAVGFLIKGLILLI